MIPLIGRVLLAVVFLVFAVRSILAFEGSARYFAGLGFPAPDAVVVLAITVQLAGGILLVVGWKTRWAAWLLALYVVVATAMAHRFWQYDAAQYANQMQHFFKNLAILGGLMMIAAYGPGRCSVDKS